MIRKLQSFLLACVVAIGTMPTMSCTSQGVLNDLEKFGPVVTNLLTVACEFTSNPFCTTGAKLLSDAEQHAFNLWQAYLNAQQKGTSTQADWNDLNAAMDTLISHSSDVFALAHVANTEDHHPDLSVGYNYCDVTFSTHSIGGLSENDFICAAKLDRL